MIYIKKGTEPESLTKYRKEKFAYYDGYKDKDDVRKKLLEEQGYLCAYCMRRIDKEHMKIEHWYPEDKLTDVERLNYQNMLGTCLGHIEGTKGFEDTCDTHKGNFLIKVNPLDKSTLTHIQYKSATGAIYSDDKDIQRDVDKTLNLNAERHLLKENRKELLNTLITEMRKMKKQGTWNKKMLETVRARYESVDVDGKKKEYAGVALWYLDKRLKSVR